MVYNSSLHELWKADERLLKNKISFSISLEHHPFFENYFLVDNADRLNLPVYILPDKCAHLLIHEWQEATNKRLQIKLVGSRSSGFCINRQKRKRTHIFRLRPETLFCWLSIPSYHFTDKSFSLEEILPHKRENTTILLEKIKEQKNPETIFQSLQQLLFNKQRYCEPPALILRLLQISKENSSLLKVSQLARQLGISDRYLRKICQEQLGQSPKQLLRIDRFTRSLQNRLEYREYTWSDIAHLSGFTDHSHLIAEYQQLVGRTPVAMFEI